MTTVKLDLVLELNRMECRREEMEFRREEMAGGAGDVFDGRARLTYTVLPRMRR